MYAVVLRCPRKATGSVSRISASPEAERLADSPRADCESWRATLPRLVLIRVTGRYRDPMIGQHFHQSGLDLVCPHVLELARRTDFLALDNRTGVGNQPAQQLDEHAKD